MFFDFIKKSLKLKIILVSVIIQFIVLLVLVINSLRIIDDSIEHQTDIKKESINLLLDSALSIPLFERDYATLIELLDKLMASKNSEFTHISIYDDKGNLFSENIRDSSLVNSTLPEHEILNLSTPLTIASDEIGIVKYGLSIRSLYAAKKDLIEESLLIIVLGIVLTITLLTITTHYLTRHITELLYCAKDVSSGNYDAKVPIKSSDEIGMLAKEFNTMTSAVKDSTAKIISKNQFLSKISSRVPGMIYQFELREDGSMHFPYVSDAIENIYQISAQDVYDNVTTIFNKTHPDDLNMVYESIQESARNLKKWSLEYRILRDDGSTHWLSGNSVPEKMPDGTILWYGFVSDVTKNKEMSDTIRRTQKMDALGKLTGGIAHDYNNMLGVILGFSELLKEQTADLPKLRSHVEEILTAGERGAKLTKKLLDFSRQKSSDITSLSINSMLINDQDMLRKTLTARIDLELNLEKDLWSVYLDESELEDTILNICINAMHAIKGNGQIKITTHNITITESNIKTPELDVGEYVKLSIADTGCGIEDHIKERIFDPFYTTKGDKGTGLGLSQVYGFVSRCNGSIDVDSKIGQGTTFNLYFPKLQCENSIKEETKTEQEINTYGSETILVVDDEPALLNLTYAILNKHGYKVLRAESAKLALEILESEHVDLLISDIIMPEMDGYELASIVHDNYPHIKIQLVSGFSNQENLNHKNCALSENMLPKPYSIKALVTKIQQLLQSDS